ncbi:hypothetical protein C9374_012773 [Naegleria lovaniensis]|uniref:PPPDE domain-containing protein n=1 Tax=Naegleria lovaniensis TaxID=51637 RepID=A0AA88GFM7_NAELO|nr:uncharacterized protein C9374_012773 [Naegleria lovaniensis]KAG2373171.1 hypothetical protein C9374_012773 [Naegleria lovaniensis]
MPPSTPKTDIYLNVYDLQDNSTMYVYGLGIYHSGLQIGGSEFTFGREGTFSHEPKKAPMVPLRESIYLTSVELPRDRIMAIVDEVSKEFNKLRYHLLDRNCNHYAKALYERILDRCGRQVKESAVPIPAYVNRSAWWGSKVKCLMPPELLNTPVPSSAEGTEAGDEVSSFTAFQGSGRTLSGRTVTPNDKKNKGFFSSLFSKDDAKESEMKYYEKNEEKDNTHNRREKLLMAAEKRLSKAPISSD